MGLYQSLMEINFYCPVEDNFSLEDRLAIFEQFWDCGAARFGDDGSLGWKNVLRRKSIQEGESEPASDDFEDRLIPGNGVEGSKAKLWLDIEVHRCVNCFKFVIFCIILKLLILDFHTCSFISV